MIYLDQAILNRWNAKNLSTYITGGIWFGDAPELEQFPYCIYTNVSDNVYEKSLVSQYSVKQIQFQIYDITAELVGQWANMIGSAFLHCDRAATNPLTLNPNEGSIINVESEGNSIIQKESDGIYSATLGFTILYNQESGLTPA